MGTTKRVSKKTASSVKKAPARKTAPKKAAAKKTPKKSIKKVVKKKVSKKTPVNKATKKKVEKKKKAPVNKLLRPKAKDTLFKAPKEKKSYRWPKSVALSLVVLPKLPVDIDTLAIGMARYGGIGVLILGAILTYFHAAALDMVPGQQFATTLSSGSGGSADSTFSNIAIEQEYVPGTEQLPLPNYDFPDPEVDFSFDASGTFVDSVEIKVIVPEVDRVDLVAQLQGTSEHFNLGTASRISNTKFVLPWDTLQYPNGTYKIKAIVIRGSHSFYKTSGEKEVLNKLNVVETVSDTSENFEEPSSDEFDDSTEGISETETTTNETVSSEEKKDSSIDSRDAEAVDPEPLLVDLTVTNIAAGSVMLQSITTPKADRVVFKFSNEVGDISTIGVGDRTSLATYRRQFKTADLDPGQYYFFADAVKDGTVTQSKKISFVAGALSETSQAIEADIKDVDDLPTAEGSQQDSETDKAEVDDEVMVVEVEDGLDLIIQSTQGAEISSIANFLITSNKPLQKIEIYARKIGNLEARYLGNANRISAGKWQYRADTRNLPSGDYVLFTRTWYEKQTFFGAETKVIVRNAIQQHVEPKLKEYSNPIDTELPEVANETSVSRLSNSDARVLEEISEVDLLDEEELVENKPADTNLAVVKEKPTFLERAARESVVLTETEIPEEIIATEDELEVANDNVVDLFAKYEERLNTAFRGLTSALRSQDATAITEARRSIKLLEDEILNSALEGPVSNDLVSLTENRLRRQLAETTLRTEQTEKIVRDRVGDEALKDTDNDGITDFDERNIYQTDPESADSDNDGFLDGIEILNGFDPTNNEPEVAVTFESPKLAGVTREDVFEVTAITAVSPEPSTQQQKSQERPAAVISGKGLPNSFVTLFVFSNPVVVTVKTDASGNWSYTFDKEIEDGEHEIYVGVTDNAGRVVAKSEPVRFVKTAQAFTPVNAADEVAVVGQVKQDNLLSTNLLLLVGSLSIVSIGVILILLGLHLRTREEHLVAEGFTSQATLT